MNKVALVTGNKGFIGAWLTKSLVRKGFTVFGIDNLSSYGDRLADKISLEKNVKKQFNIDICDLESMKAIIVETQPSLIINMAGQAIVPRAFKEPFMTYKTNTLGTLSILEAARQTGIPKAISLITSDKVYKNNDQIWPFRENDNLGGKDIYSVSKSSAELVCSAYAQSHLVGTGINIQTIRLGNVIGGGDWSMNRLIPDMMNAIQNDGQFYIRYPNATRPFQHVLDVVDGVIKISNAALSNKIKSGEAWNLGPKNNTVAKVSDVVNLCKNTWPKLKFEQNPDPVPEDLNLSVEIVKYKSVFGNPKFTSADALELTIQWYKKYYNSVSVEELIENELTMYEKSV
jgi:CDP-glucose 4,6-dehydratase